MVYEKDNVSVILVSGFVCAGSEPIYCSVLNSSYKCDTFVCDMVKGIELSVNREYGMVACSWLDDTLLHSEWELSYGPAGTPPGGGRVVHASEPHWVVTGLEDTVDYVFYVRGLCEECNVWCDWSEGMVAYAEQRGTEGIMRPEQLDAMTYVVPNPARDKARVGSEYGVLRVALYDVRGRAALVWHSPQGGGGLCVG